MERHRQQIPKLIPIEDWLAKAHPDAPGLPWKSDDGEEICSFLLQPLTDAGRTRSIAENRDRSHSRVCGPLAR